VPVLAIGPNRSLFGTTLGGGAANAGTIFELKRPAAPGGNWREKVLYSFTDPLDGGNPAAPLIIAKNAALFGTAQLGGAFNAGVVFALAPPASPGGDWAERLLYTFEGGSDGAHPAAALLATKNGLLFGTTAGGSFFRAAWNGLRSQALTRTSFRLIGIDVHSSTVPNRKMLIGSGTEATAPTCPCNMPLPELAGVIQS
jgi:uncharacterized repeat protein (TIGR03803 family)